MEKAANREIKAVLQSPETVLEAATRNGSSSKVAGLMSISKIQIRIKENLKFRVKRKVKPI